MRLVIAVVLGLVLAVSARPHDHQNASCPHGNGNGDNGNGNGDNGNGNGNGDNGNGNGNNTEPIEPIFGDFIVPYVPFPHFDDFALFEVDGNTLLPGSAFVQVSATGECNRVQLSDELGGRCPLNQTICDIIASTPCEPAVANATCFSPPRPGQAVDPALPTNIPEAEFGNGYPYGGPLCHVEANGIKVQPSAYTSLNFLTPSIQVCVFQVAPAPTTTAEPVLAVDPPCPFIES